MNANDAALTGLTTAHTGSTVADPAPNAPAHPGFDLVLEAAADSALGSCGARSTLTISAIDPTTARHAWPAHACRQAFDAASGWELSGPGPDYQCIQTFPVTIPTLPVTTAPCPTPRFHAASPRRHYRQLDRARSSLIGTNRNTLLRLNNITTGSAFQLVTKNAK